jgi:hypothetical protein
MKWAVAIVVLVTAAFGAVGGYFVLMVLLNGASQRGASAALGFFATGVSVAVVAAAIVGAVMTSLKARTQPNRFLQLVWGTAAGWGSLAVLTFLMMLISFGIAS